MHSLGIVQWNSTRRDHPGNLGGVSGSGPVNFHETIERNIDIDIIEMSNCTKYPRIILSLSIP